MKSFCATPGYSHTTITEGNGEPLQGWAPEQNMNPTGSWKTGWTYSWCSTQRNRWSLIQWCIELPYPELDHPNSHSSVLWPYTMVTFDCLQYASLTERTLPHLGFSTTPMHLPPFLRYQHTPNTLWLCELSKGLLQPSCPYSYKRAGLHGLMLVSLLLDLWGINTTWLKHLAVVGVNPLPALPLPFSLNKPRGLWLDPLVLHQDQCLSCTDSQN